MVSFLSNNHVLSVPSILAAGLLVTLAACQQTTATDQSVPPEAVVTAAGAPAPAVSAMPQLLGPKRTIAVGKFDAIGSFVQKYGDWDIGGGLAAMLTSSLVQSERFVVVERAELTEILSEQQLKAEGLVNRETGPALGKLAGVQYLVYGAVTEFGAEDKGGGVNFGFMGGGRSPFTLGGAHESASGNVAMDVRVIDTTTGEVVESHTVSQPIEASGFSLSGGYSGISLGGDKFEQTPLGEATRAAINDAVAKIIGTAAKKPWTGRVVDVDGYDIYINAGASSGLAIGDMFMVERVSKVLTDPTTGQVLGSKRAEVGLLKVNAIQDKLATASFVSLGAVSMPRRGDLVVTVMK